MPSLSCFWQGLTAPTATIEICDLNQKEDVTFTTKLSMLRMLKVGQVAGRAKRCKTRSLEPSSNTHESDAQ
jgi:hypothetical protein